MTDLDTTFGNANSPSSDTIFRDMHKPLPISGECIWFSFYMEAPQIVDWLKERGVNAHFEQRKNEGVSIVLPDHRAFVGNHIFVHGSQVRVI